MSDSHKRTIGLDLGTTNTIAASEGVVIGADAEALLRSAVAFMPNGTKRIGAGARRRLAMDPTNTIVSSKRIIGRKLDSATVTAFKSRYPYELVEGEEQRACFQTRAGKFDPTDIAALIVEATLAKADMQRDALSAIVTVPTTFRKEEEAATLEACRKAGLGQVSTISEPLATAQAYQSDLKARSGTFAVYDLGGGTFDVAVVRSEGDTLEVLAHSGDRYLGGDDIDRGLADWVADHVLETQRWDLRSSSDCYARLVESCESVKVALSFAPEAKLNLAMVETAVALKTPSITINQDTLTKLSMTLVGKTFVLCDELLHRVGLKTSDIDEVFLAGGSTKLVCVRDGLAAYFGKAPCCEHDPMKVVAIGSSIVAKQRFR